MEFGHSKALALDQENASLQYQGVLKKWTNYVLGWKDRFFVLKQGNLLYYKSQEDAQFGCRGAISLANASITPHTIDECRFDVKIFDLMWYLRSDTAEERQNWLEVLRAVYPNTERVSCMSNQVAVADKLKDLETYRDSIKKQFEVLVGSLDKHYASSSVSVRGELVTFEAATVAFFTAMSECIEMMKEWEQYRITKELQSSFAGLEKAESIYDRVCPEMIEGQHCLLGDGEFYDAVEYSIERIEEEVMLRKRLESVSLEEEVTSCEDVVSKHPLWGDIVKVVEEQVKMTNSGEDEDSWTLLMKENHLEMFTRELEIDGIVSDPLKARCSISGVSGREITHYFFNPQYRKDWETALEQMTVVERIRDDTILFHQIYKRIWPTAQRDLLFWSHLTRKEDPNGVDVWAVVNKSLDHPQFPANGKFVRMELSLCLYCVTEISRPAKNKEITRDDVVCHLTYCSTVNPGGWVPASAVRALRRKEYPKFLRKFSNYVQEQTRNRELMI